MTQTGVPWTHGTSGGRLSLDLHVPLRPIFGRQPAEFHEFFKPCWTNKINSWFLLWFFGYFQNQLYFTNLYQRLQQTPTDYQSNYMAKFGLNMGVQIGTLNWWPKQLHWCRLHPNSTVPNMCLNPLPWVSWGVFTMNGGSWVYDFLPGRKKIPSGSALDCSCLAWFNSRKLRPRAKSSILGVTRSDPGNFTNMKVETHCVWTDVNLCLSAKRSL